MVSQKQHLKICTETHWIWLPVKAYQKFASSIKSDSIVTMQSSSPLGSVACVQLFSLETMTSPNTREINAITVSESKPDRPNYSSAYLRCEM